MTVLFKASGITEIHNVRRIEQDHKDWFVWSGEPKNGIDRLRPQVFHKADGELIVKEVQKC